MANSGNQTGDDALLARIAARNGLSLAVQNRGWYGGHDTEIAALTEALEAAGINTAAVIARAEAKQTNEAAEAAVVHAEAMRRINGLASA